MPIAFQKREISIFFQTGTEKSGEKINLKKGIVNARKHEAGLNILNIKTYCMRSNQGTCCLQQNNVANKRVFL